MPASFQCFGDSLKRAKIPTRFEESFTSDRGRDSHVFSSYDYVTVFHQQSLVSIADRNDDVVISCGHDLQFARTMDCSQFCLLDGPCL
jgi:hypothetical protein